MDRITDAHGTLERDAQPGRRPRRRCREPALSVQRGAAAQPKRRLPGGQLPCLAGSGGQQLQPVQFTSQDAPLAVEQLTSAAGRRELPP